MINTKIPTVIVFFIIIFLISSTAIFAGNLDPTENPAPTMETLDTISTQHDLIKNNLINLVNHVKQSSCTDAPVPRTGQANPIVIGDDGHLRKGIHWQSPRFTDNGNGTVTDNLTGLIWLKNANRFGAQTWENAISICNNLANGDTLTDGSVAGDWRLPNLIELESLQTIAYYSPCIPNTNGTGPWSQGNPFDNIQLTFYWSSTASASNNENKWQMRMDTGIEYFANKANAYYVWPVRN